MVDSLPADSLRWRCDMSELTFEGTHDVEPVHGVVGQDSAVDALRFGIECNAPGQNVFVRGLTGTGRMSLVRRLLEDLMPRCERANDHCYVHDFGSPDRPRLLTLPPGEGRRFRRSVREIAKFVREDLPELLNGEAVQERRDAIEAETRQRLEAVTSPFEAELREAQMTMVQQQQGQGVQTAIVPLVDGKPVAAQDLTKLREEGKIDDAQLAAWRDARERFGKRLVEVSREVSKIRADTGRRVITVIEDTARALLAEQLAPTREAFPQEAVAAFLDEVADDVVDNLGRTQPGEDPARFYDVNVLLECEERERCPVVVETAPSLVNLLGAVEPGWTERGPAQGDFRNVRAGSLLRANGGYLVVEARDLLTEPGAWKVLVRTLRTGQLEIVPQELAFPYLRSTIKPEPIPIQVRVILVGDGGLYYALDRGDPDFGHLFKVLADFDHEIPRTPGGVEKYAGVLARIVREEGLPHFDKSAIAALAEHGARIAARHNKLTARFARIADIAREAAYLARKRGADERVVAADVHETVRRTKARADLPSRRFQSMIAERTIVIETEGAVVGQVNGLAVIQAGMLTYGFPARITATIGPGNAGVIDIEGRASLSGQIHTKGFHILGGLLRHLLNTEHALAFSASLAFEQSYGGIDGDSASGAEMCCLLSALTGVPLRQDVAMTGAIDQHGRVQAIGGVNEKIEGYFDACASLGFSGNGGVIVPRANAGDLMLRRDVVEACEAGRFHVWAVDSVHEALEVFTGMPAGEPQEDGTYPEDTLLHIAQQKAFEYWDRSLASPAAFIALEEDDEGEERSEGAPGAAAQP